MSSKKNEGLAAVLSLVLSGLGQIYVGRIGRGIAILFGGIVISIFGATFNLGILALIYWIWNVYDAYNLAKKYNIELRTTVLPTERPTIPIKPNLARCETCGNQLNEGDNFCQVCGTAVVKKIQSVSDTRTFPPEALSYQEQIEKYQKALSFLENQRTIGEVSAESYNMAKTNLERELQKLLQYREEVDGAKKSVIEGIQSRGSIGKADFIKDFNIRSEIVNEAMEQLLKENIIEKTETGERYRLKGKTKRCPYCRGSIPADLSVCPLCGSIIG